MGFLSKVVKAVDNVTGGFFSDQSGRSQQKDANKMAMQAWNLANDYNSPKAQVDRLVAAGLNPYLVNLSGNTAGVPGLTGGNVQTGTESLFSGLNNIMGSLQGVANLNNTRAQTQASSAAAGASAAQANYTNVQMEGQETKNKFLEKSMIADLDYKKAQTKLLDQQTEKTKYETDITKGEAGIFGDVGGTKGAGTIGKGFAKGAQFIRGIMK